MLVRDAPQAPGGIEVFMLRRNLRSVFVAGAFVFPGGAVDDADRAISPPELVDGIDDATASRLLGRAHGGLAFWVAAIRESFEEAGVLLAKDARRVAPPRPMSSSAWYPCAPRSLRAHCGSPRSCSRTG